MQDFLKALEIISTSWPLTFMLGALVGSIALVRMVRITNKASVDRKTVEAEKELELKRLSFENGSADVKKVPARRHDHEEY